MRQNRGEGGGGEEKYACIQPLFVWRTPVRWIDGGALLGLVPDVSITSCQSRSHRNTHFPGLPWQCICNTLIHPDFEQFHFALEEFFQFLGLHISLINGRKASGYHNILETRFIGLIFQFLVRVKEILKSKHACVIFV